jgi:hypothetical protein
MKILRRLKKATWGRPKHRGVSGNFSTVVIITGIVIGGYIMTGGSYPNVYPKFTTPPIEGQPLENQPNHTAESSLAMRELRMRKVPPGSNKPPDTDPPSDQVCSKTAFIFLVDVSTSMKETAGSESKLSNVRAALTDFTSDLADDAVIGLYTFSSPNGGEPRMRTPISLYNSASQRFTADVNNIQDPGSNAATHMRAGFEFVQGPLAAAKQQFPGYTLNLVFLSDGVPEQEGYPGGPGCVAEYTIGGVCPPPGTNDDRSFDMRHDPTSYWADIGKLLPVNAYPDITREIKDTGVGIYSIAISNATDTDVFPELDDLMLRISSGDTYYLRSTGATDMAHLFGNIKSDACT